MHFPAPTGSIDFDPEQPGRGARQRHPLARGATTGVPIVDALVRSPGYLGAATWPEMTFRLDRLTPTSKQTAEVAGRITLRGVTRPIAFAARVVRFGPAADDPDRFEAGFDLEGSHRPDRVRLDRRPAAGPRRAADPYPPADALRVAPCASATAPRGWAAVTPPAARGMAR